MTPTPRTAIERLRYRIGETGIAGESALLEAALREAAQAAPPDASEQHTITLSRYLTLVDEIASLRALDVERLARILRQTYTLHFPRAGERDWRSDADYISAAYAERQGEQPDPLLTYTDPAGGPDWEPREDER